jgi:2-C-methyl-D-erythritol 4-phosphate cytidylyltransferase
MQYIEEDGIVAVHDAVRPFVKTDFLNSIYSEATSKGAVIPYISPSDSMRKRGELLSLEHSVYVDRDQYIMIQTPQVFKTNILLSSYQSPYNPKYTDDASVVEDKGYNLSFIQGDPLNIKLTRPQDLEMARAILSVFSQ